MDKEAIEKKRQSEMQLVSQMIELYCRHHHADRTADQGTVGAKHSSENDADGKRNSRKRGGVCPECQELMDYARARSEHCPFMETKTFCSNCKVHCYSPEMREKIRIVMRYSGPRMLWHHPMTCIFHAVSTIQNQVQAKGLVKRANENEKIRR